MTLINTVDNCEIFDKFLIDDLIGHSIEEDSSGPYIKYVDGQIARVAMRDADLVSLKNTSLGQSSIANVWYPIFITDDTFISTKQLSADGAIKNANPALTSARLGIEDFITFKPQFQNWLTTDSSLMTVDWILNQVYFPYSLQYGLLGWVKTIPNTSVDFLGNAGSIDKFPIGARLQTNSGALNNIPLIKLDNNTLYRVDKDNELIKSSTTITDLLDISFDSVSLVKVSDLGSNPVFYLSSTDISSSSNSIFGGPDKTLLWVSNGDFFSYFENEQDRQQEQLSKNIISKSYLSPALYSTYTQIYNIVTANEIRRLDRGMNLKKARLVKKISFILSTSPLMTDFGINSLNMPEIRTYIDNYINGNGANTITNEILDLKNVVVNIHKFLQTYTDNTGKAVNLGNPISYKTTTDNIIYTKSQLLKKLINKYGATLKLSGDTFLRYKNLLPNGDSVYISQIAKHFCDKSLVGTAIYPAMSPKPRPTTVFNNTTIELSDIKIKSIISDTESQISLNKSNEIKVLPLSDIGKEVFQDFTINIVMAETTNVKKKYRQDNQDGVTINRYVANNYIFETEKIAITNNDGSINDTRIKFAAINISSFLESKVSAYWEQIGGPCLKFSDSNKTAETLSGKPNLLFEQARYDSSTQLDPFVYLRDTGEYKIQCTVSTPNGTFVKKKTFYVVNGTQKDPDRKLSTIPSYGKYAPEGTIYNAGIGQFCYPENPNIPVEGLSPGPINTIEAQPILITSDHLKIICSSLSEIAVHKSGLFWPMKTLYKYTTINGEFTLEGTAKFSFGSSVPDTGVGNKNSQLNIAYNTNNTTIKLFKVVLKNTRNNTDCGQCLSFFYPNSYSTSAIIPGTRPLERRAVVLRGEKIPDGITLKKITWNSQTNQISNTTEFVNFGYPPISTLNAPPIKTYGGYSRGIINDIGVVIPDHVRPPLNAAEFFPAGVAAVPNILPVVTGYKLDYKADSIPGQPINNSIKLCYQQATTQTDSYIEFHKGVFHPSSGWIQAPSEEFNTHANLSSVLKFNPGARESFSFTGPGLINLKSTYNSNFENIPNVYKSSIKLNIASPIHWDPFKSNCVPVDPEDLKEHEKNNQINKELADQYSGGSTYLHHGYRYLNGGLPKTAELGISTNSEVVDEFGFEANKASCQPGESLTNINSATYTYSFAVTGPSNPIGSDKGLRNPRINTLNIQDLEVKLNFLNYVNTKNLVIWLDVSPSAESRKQLAQSKSGKAQCPITRADGFIDKKFPNGLYGKPNFYSHCGESVKTTIPNTGVAEYLSDLIDMNSTYTWVEPLRLYLLNKEHIQNNKFNMSIKFSDHASKYNVPFDQNSLTSEGIGLQQNIINDNYEIQPTIASTGYSDISSVLYQNIIRNNQLNVVNNHFAKFKNRSLFINPPAEDDKSCPIHPTYDSSTVFTLNIMVLDDYDEMKLYDMVNNNSLLTGYDTPDVKQRSAEIFNSLCSWEIILHTDKTRKYVASKGGDLDAYGNTDPLALIEYGKEPRYPGYGFIADMSNKKHLLPNVNLNAPYVYINDSSLCDFADPDNRPKASMIRPPTFPTDAILNIMVGTTSGFASGGGGLIGATMGFGASYSSGFNQIMEYFASNRLYNNITEKARFAYAPRYSNFPFGSPEKILLNVSKDGGIWYKLEASVFKYKNTPVLEHNKYKFVKLGRGTMPGLSEFAMESVTDVGQLLDNNMFINISLGELDLINAQEGTESNVSYLASKIKDIDKISSLADGTLFQLTCTVPLAQDYLGGFYIKDNDTIYRITKSGSRDSDLPLEPGRLVSSNKILSHNNILSYKTNIFNSPLNNLVLLEGKIPFYVFGVSDTVNIYNESTRDSTDPVSVIINQKGLIIKDNRYYTVLELSASINTNNLISHVSNSDTIVVFKPQTTKITEQPINVWGLEKEQIHQTVPDTQFSTTGLGAYGNGSPFKNKEILTYKLQKNQLKTIYELFNNHINDRFKFNNMTIFTESLTEDGQTTTTVTPIENNNGALGYACSLKDIKNIFLNGGFKFIRHPNMTDAQYETLLEALTNTVADIPDTAMQIIFIKCPHLASEELSSVRYGEIIFDEDYIQAAPTNHLDQETITTVVTRLNSLESNNIDITSEIGKPARTSNIINVGSISDLENHYNSLEEDPLSCYQKSNSSNRSSCYKRLTKQAILNRYKERNDLIRLLQNQTTRTTDADGNVTYTAKTSNSSILPYTRVSVTPANQNSNNTVGEGSLSITYEDISDNYYWINIDPKQSCSIAEEDCPKILIKTQYVCGYANAASGPLDNNICPGNMLAGGQIPVSGGAVSLGAGSIPGGLFGSDMRITYEIPQVTIDKQKQEYETKYPNIKWKTNHIVERTFFVNDDFAAGTQDLVVRATETYLLAVPCHIKTDNNPIPTSCYKNDGSADVSKGLAGPFGSRQNTLTRVYNIFNLDDQNTLKVRFRKVPRQVRSIDYYTTVYKYGSAGTEFRPNSSFESPPELNIGQSLNNYFYVWQCLQKDQNNQLQYSTTPDFLKLQNEMLYRAFFGSVDGIENKTDELKSLSPWELIPYEYDI
jgi:hypothetical protein